MPSCAAASSSVSVICSGFIVDPFYPLSRRAESFRFSRTVEAGLGRASLGVALGRRPPSTFGGTIDVEDLRPADVVLRLVARQAAELAHDRGHALGLVEDRPNVGDEGVGRPELA